tara:strand:+ start:1429 stop:1842 length:414 start_codon:yes stop_codon:yes gene_type:complete
MISKEIQEKCLEYLSEINTIERVKNISYELMKKSIYFQLKKYLDPPSEMYYLEDNTSIPERENIVRFLSKCKCCKEHERERPSLIDYNNGHMPEYPNPFIDWKLDTLTKIGDQNCDCYCRFVCRYICRIDNDEIIMD